MIKHHPRNKRERLDIEKIKKFEKSSKDRPGHVRRKLARETEEVKELDHELGEIALGATHQEAHQEPVA